MIPPRSEILAAIEKRLTEPFVTMNDIGTIRWLLSELKAAEAKLAEAREVVEPFADAADLFVGVPAKRQINAETQRTRLEERSTGPSEPWVFCWALRAGHFHAARDWLNQQERT